MRFHLFLTVLLALGAAVAGQGSTNSTANATLASTLAAQDDLSTLLAAVSACPPVLAAANNSFIAVTLFAPSNEAFDELLVDLNTTVDDLFNNTDLLCPLLEYHIVPYPVPSTSIPVNATMLPTLLMGANLTVQRVNDTVYVNNATVETANITAGRSIVHIIDAVLLPPVASPPPYPPPAPPSYPPPYPPSPPPSPPPSIATVGGFIPDLSSLLDALTACPDLQAAATNPSAVITIFAPTNEAFETALANLNTTIANLTSQGILCPLLEYHVAPGLIPADLGMANATSVATLLPGANVTLDSINGTNYVNDATITIPNIFVGGSAIQVIDRVLIPPLDLLYGNGTNTTNATNATNATSATNGARMSAPRSRALRGYRMLTRSLFKRKWL